MSDTSLAKGTFSGEEPPEGAGNPTAPCDTGASRRCWPSRAGPWEIGKWSRHCCSSKSCSLEMLHCDNLARLELLKELETAIWRPADLHTKLTELLALTGLVKARLLPGGENTQL